MKCPLRCQYSSSLTIISVAHLHINGDVVSRVTPSFAIKRSGSLSIMCFSCSGNDCMMIIYGIVDRFVEDKCIISRAHFSKSCM